jgi:hypothetical protein
MEIIMDILSTLSITTPPRPNSAGLLTRDMKFLRYTIGRVKSFDFGL